MKNIDFLKNKIIAHRGIYDNKKIPENSLGSFKDALKEGYTIELDVHITKDNQIVVFHDHNLKRMTNVDNEVEKVNYTDIKDLKLLNTNYKIPLLKDVLSLVNKKVPIIIELKVKDIKSVGTLEKTLADMLDNYDGEFAVKSFNPFSVRWFKKYRSSYVRGLLVSNKNKTIKDKILHNMYLLNICSPDFISCSYKMFDNKKINKLKKNHVILAWTIKDTKDFIKYKKCFDNLICENKEVLKWKN